MIIFLITATPLLILNSMSNGKSMEKKCLIKAIKAIIGGINITFIWIL